MTTYLDSNLYCIDNHISHVQMLLHGMADCRYVLGKFESLSLLVGLVLFICPLFQTGSPIQIRVSPRSSPIPTHRIGKPYPRVIFQQNPGVDNPASHQAVYVVMNVPMPKWTLKDHSAGPLTEDDRTTVVRTNIEE